MKPINVICFMNLKCRSNFKMENYLWHNSHYSLALSFLKITEIDLKEAQRFFAQKFSCGASVTGEDEIIIQGDFTDDIIDVIQEKWPEVRIWTTSIYGEKLWKQVASVLFEIPTHGLWLSVFYRWMTIALRILEKWRSDFENVSVFNGLNWELI